MKGEFRYNIDAKGRVFMPAKLRTSLGERFVITKGIDDCLFVYSAEAWASLEEKISQYSISKARKLQRFFCASACDAQPDSQGRVLIPSNLREYAGLTKDITIIGVSTRAEIWDTAKWNEYNENITSEEIEAVIEEIDI